MGLQARVGAKKGAGGEITNYGDNTRRSLLAVTLVTVLAIISVVTVYAVLIGTFESTGEVTIGSGATGAVTYSLDGLTWGGSLSPTDVDTTWYSKLNINGGQYSGRAVTISWQLQRKINDTAWSNLGTPTVTSMSLGAGAQDVYATSTGVSTGNRDWGLDVTEEGIYKVVASVNSA